jgi:glycosyltransferase involved in cell wall biosynthesis
LVIVGDTRPDDEPYRTALRALAERLGIASAVVWAGGRTGEETSGILQSGDLYVVPYDDGASVRRGSLMAGLAHGLPVVSTCSRLESVYLKDGLNIALVPPKNADALASRITSLLMRPEEAAALGKAALALAEQFSWVAIARQTRAVYERVLSLSR